MRKIIHKINDYIKKRILRVISVMLNNKMIPYANFRFKNLLIIFAVVLLACQSCFVVSASDEISLSYLAPQSRFKPAVELFWGPSRNGYIIRENAEENGLFQNQIASFQDDMAFVYTTLLISQFVNELDALRAKGLSNHGVDARLEAFKRDVNGYLSSKKILTARFHIGRLYFDGTAVCLPYTRKDDPEVEHILRYDLRPEGDVTIVPKKLISDLRGVSYRDVSLSVENKINPVGISGYASYGKGPVRTKNRSGIASEIFPSKLLNRGSYKPKLWESGNIKEDISSENAKKIERALKIINTKKSPSYRKRAQSFKTDVAIVEIEMPIAFIAYGKDLNGEPYWQLTYLEVTKADRGSIQARLSLTKAFLDSLNVENTEDMKLLATILNHDMAEIEMIKTAIKTKGIVTIEDIDRFHRSIVGRMANPFGLSCVSRGQEKDAGELIDKYIERRFFDHTEAMKSLISDVWQRLWDESLLDSAQIGREESKEIMGQPDYNKLRSLYIKIGKIYTFMGFCYDFEGKRDHAIEYYKRGRRNFNNVGLVDAGLLPIQNQIRLVCLLAHQLNLELLRYELRKFQSYDNFFNAPRRVKLDAKFIEDDRAAFYRIMRFLLPMMKQSVISTLEYHFNSGHIKDAERAGLTREIEDIIKYVKEINCADFDINQGKKVAIEFKDSVIERAGKDEKSGRKTILAFGTSWIPGYDENNPSGQYGYVKQLIQAARKFCRQNGIALIDAEDEDLSERISQQKNEEGFADAKIYAVAGAQDLEKNLSDFLNDKDALFFGVDSSKMTDDSYLRIMEILKAALNHTGDLSSPPDTIHVPVERRGNIWIFVPRAEPMKLETLKLIYLTQMSA